MSVGVPDSIPANRRKAKTETYLDWNATAPLRPEAVAAMSAALIRCGNPSFLPVRGVWGGRASGPPSFTLVGVGREAASGCCRNPGARGSGASRREVCLAETLRISV